MPTCSTVGIRMAASTFGRRAPWDAERRVIGIRGCAIESLDAYPVRQQSPGSNRGPVLIAGSLFTRYIGLATSAAERWVPSVEDGVRSSTSRFEGSPCP